jgi:hypothetical protein
LRRGRDASPEIFAVFPAKLETLPDIGLGTVALAIVAVCALIAAGRGLVRLFLGVFLLASSVLAGFLTWQHAPGLARQWIEPPAWLPSVLAPAAGILTFLALRWLLRILADPLGRGRAPAETAPRPGPLRLAFIMLTSVIPAAVVVFLVAAVLRHAGSLSELRTAAESRAGGEAPPLSQWLVRTKTAIDQAIPPEWFQFVDPLTDNARLAVAKWIAADAAERGAGDSPEPVIDTATGDPIPRAIIVDDEDLRELARSGRYAEMLRDPRIDKALEDPATRRAVLGAEP